MVRFYRFLPCVKSKMCGWLDTFNILSKRFNDVAVDGGFASDSATCLLMMCPRADAVQRFGFRAILLHMFTVSEDSRMLLHCHLLSAVYLPLRLWISLMFHVRCTLDLLNNFERITVYAAVRQKRHFSILKSCFETFLFG